MGELAADGAAFAFNAGDLHGIVAGGLVTHPGDRGGFGALLDGNAFGARDGAAADGRGVRGDLIGHGSGGELVARMEGEEGQNRGPEIGDVNGFGDGAALAAGIEFLLIAGVGAFKGEGGAEGGDAVGGSPDTAGEAFVALLLDHGPRGTVGFDPAAEGGVTRRQEVPIGGHRENSAGGVEDVTRFGEGTNFFGVGGGQGRGELAETGGCHELNAFSGVHGFFC